MRITDLMFDCSPFTLVLVPAAQTVEALDNHNNCIVVTPPSNIMKIIYIYIYMGQNRTLIKCKSE